MPKTNRWVSGVKTVSTYPPEGLFKKDPKIIARVMASKKVSPKGIGSAVRMVQFFISWAGRNLPAQASMRPGASQSNPASPTRQGKTLQASISKE
jgi:hypothetical protein